MENNIIKLSAEQRGALERYVKNGTHNAHLIMRARVILALDRSNKKDHLRITRISEQIRIGRRSIYRIKEDFLKSTSIEQFLTRKKRETPPIPTKITGEVEARIIALACSTPPEGYARWSVRLLTKHSFGIELSYSTVYKALKKLNISLT